MFKEIRERHSDIQSRIDNGILNKPMQIDESIFAHLDRGNLLQSLDDAFPILKFVADSCFGPKSEEARGLLKRREGK